MRNSAASRPDSQADPRPRILLDCDPGLDDAIAILVAAHHGELVGITTVNGNVGIDYTTRNALTTTQIANIDVPVHRGAAQPLIAPLMNAARIHGPTGLGAVELPELNRSATPGSAAAYISETARPSTIFIWWRSVHSPTWPWRCATTRNWSVTWPVSP